MNPVPAGLLSALGLRSLETAGVPAGAHVRVVPSGALALPLHPFLVYPASNPIDEVPHVGVVTAGGEQAQLPLDVSSDAGPVTLLLDPPRGTECVLAVVEADPGSALTVEVIAPSLRGDLTVTASDGEPPYSVGASAIRRLRVSGNGTITSVSWALDSDLKYDTSVKPARLGLPIVLEESPWYVDDPEAAAVAADRIAARAPLLTSPLDPPAGSVIENAERLELQRVAALTAGLDEQLRGAYGDPSTPPVAALLPAPLAGRLAGGAQIPILSSLLLAAVDPGVARWLGLMGMVDSPDAGRGWAPMQLVVATFAVHRDTPVSAFAGPGRLLTLLPDDDPGLRRVCLDAYGDLERVLDSLPQGFEARTLTCAVGIPLDDEAALPSAPSPPAASSLGWNGRTRGAPETQRVRLALTDPAPAWMLALERRGGSDPKPLNPLQAVPSGFRGVAFAAGRSDGPDGGPAVFDEAAPGAEVSDYLLWQSDAFGRFGPPTETSQQPAVRPPPPAPAIEVEYLQPALAPDDHSEASGTLVVRAPVPPLDTLAPGALEIAAIEVQLDGEPHVGAPSGDQVTVAAAGPALRPGGAGTLPITAHFVDLDGTRSTPSRAARRLADARPVEHVTLPPALAYASAPDTLGRATIDLAWPAVAEAAGYRVYVAYEVVLRTALEREHAAAFIAELDAAVDAPHRAEVIRTRRGELRREWFEPLSATPQRRALLRHDVPGALRELVVLRVTTVTAGGVESPFASAPIAVYGVPSSLAPSPPQVVVERVDGRFVVTITAASAPVRATRFRLQRTRRGLADPLSMPVVAAGELTAQPDGRTAATVADPGAPESFMRWTWVAVVSAGVEPGSSRGATWSAPSPPLSITPVPDAAPEPVTSLAVEAGASQGVVVRFSAPLGLHGHRAVTTRITDDGAALVAETQLPENEDVTVVDDPGGAPGDRYAVTLIDPLGRAGTPATASAP